MADDSAAATAGLSAIALLAAAFFVTLFAAAGRAAATFSAVAPVDVAFCADGSFAFDLAVAFADGAAVDKSRRPAGRRLAALIAAP